VESQNRMQTIPPPTTRLRASIIVSTWNGRHLLETCLPRLLTAVARDGRRHEIIVVDDASRDDTVAFVRAEFPQVRLLPLKWNHRFAGANNVAAGVASGDVLIFLNNDMLVERDFIGPLLRHFAEPDVFAVTAHLHMQPRQTAFGPVRETGLVRARFEDGAFVLQHDDPESEKAVPVIYAGGGSSAWRRDRFLQLGGFDTLFRPFYFEDLDVSYRGQKHGWRILFEPASCAEHQHQQTNNPSNFPPGFVEIAFQKNTLLFTWKVLTDREFIGAHFRALRRLLASPHCDPWLRRGFLRAVRQLPELLWKRRRARRGLALTDREVFAAAGTGGQGSGARGEGEGQREEGERATAPVPSAHGSADRGALRRRLRAALVGALRWPARAALVRRSVAPWGLDAAEPPLRALAIQAGPPALTQRVVAEIRTRFPLTEVTVLAPEGTADEMGAPTIGAPCAAPAGYHLTLGLLRMLRARRFDAVFVAGEGGRRAEVAAFLAGGRKVEVREDGAAHQFSFAPWRPFLALPLALARGVRSAALSLLVVLVWGCITVEGWGQRAPVARGER
jgi:GT2 family glycosyltransferase